MCESSDSKWAGVPPLKTNTVLFHGQAGSRIILVSMRHTLLKVLRYGSLPLATAGLLAFLFMRPATHNLNFTALAQGTPNCQFTQSFTVAGVGNVVSNGPTVSGGPQGCVAFRLVYWIQSGTGTVSALSIELDGASLSGGSYTALTPAVGGGSGSGSTLNPVTTSPRGQNVTCCDYWPFLQIKVNTLTVASGTPVLIVKVLGYAGTSAASGSGSGGGGGLTCLNGDVDAGTGSCTSATVVGLESVPFCTGYTPTNGQFVQYTTGGSPSPCYSAAAASGGVHGTATFSATGGTISGLHVTGCVTNATRASQGVFTMTISGCPANYLILLTSTVDTAYVICNVVPASQGSTSFQFQTVNQAGALFEDPSAVYVLVP
jgi:hypothetical protein